MQRLLFGLRPLRVVQRTQCRGLSGAAPISEPPSLSRNALLLQNIREQQRVKAAKNAKKNENHMKTITNEWTPRELRWGLTVWGVAFVGFMTWAVSYGRSVQLKTSPIFKGVMFTLRQDPSVRKWIGNNLEASKYIDGSINHIKGKADISFGITGSLGKGDVRLSAVRRGEDWIIRRMSVVIAGEKIVEINDD